MFTAEHAWLIWLVAGLLLVAIEAASADFVFLMLAGGALAGSATAGLGGNVLAQAIVAALVGILLLVLVRPPLKRRFAVAPSHDLGAGAHIGRGALVVEPVHARDGRIKLAGEVWSARLDDVYADEGELPTGTPVTVLRIDGATAIVRPDPAGPPNELDIRRS